MLRRGSLLLLSFGAACLGPGALPPPEEPPVVQTFVLPSDGSAPLLLDVPFPSDLYREPDGTLVDLPGLNRLSNGVSVQGAAAQLGRMNGFGLSTGVFFAFSGAIDPASLTSGSAALVDIDPDSPQNGEAIQTELRFDATTGRLSLMPKAGEPLREGNTYAAFIKQPLLDLQGRPVSADKTFLEILSNTPGAAPEVEAAKTLLLPAADELIANGFLQDRSELIGLTVYTTQSITQDLVAIREMLDDPPQLPAPQVQFPDTELIFDTPAKLDALLGDASNNQGQEVLGRDQSGGVAHGHIGVVASGFYTSPQFQPDDQGSNDDEQLSYDANGKPLVINPSRLLPLYVVLPDPAQSLMPANGYPVIIWQHGLGNDRTAVWDFCDAFVEAGFAILAIDAVNHGSRFPNAQDTKNNLDRDGFLGVATQLDGIADTDFDPTQAFFENLLNLAGIRDNFRQSVIDLLALARLVREPSLDLSALAGPSSPFAGTTIKLDSTQLFYYGSSFGGILGGTFSSVEPTLKGSVLNVPGGSLLLDVFSQSAAIGGQILPSLSFLWALTPGFRFERDDLFMNIGQTLLEGGDPVIYAPHLLREPFTINGSTAPKKHMLIIEVIGDELVSNAGTEALARAFGLALGEPFYPGGPFYPSGAESGLATCDTTTGECDGFVEGFTATLLQESPATHGQNLSSHSGTLFFEPGFPQSDPQNPFPQLTQPVTVSTPIETGVPVLVDFFVDIRGGVTPRVTHPAPPRADFDDDGAEDATDNAPTNPFVQ